LWQGFDDGVNTVWYPGPGHPEGMLAVIKRFLAVGGKNRKLFVTGHSLGAALATVATARLAFVEKINIAAMYTIGGPRRGSLRAPPPPPPPPRRCFRCRNNNDIVPRVPPSPYEHIGHEIYFDRL
ncbi:unnamed protein product, partial [Hapterophycus canaliculatus]